MTKVTPPAAGATQPPAGQTASSEPAGSARVTGAPDLVRATAEEVQVAKDHTGEPTSASVEPRPATIEEALGLPVRARATRAAPPMLLGTTLPARTRVLQSGLEVPAHPRAAEAGEERVFTAKARILRNRILYDVGAPVPLTRQEFVSKRRVDAVEEMSFEEGDDMPERVFPFNAAPA